MRTFDVAVIGLGAMGSAALYQLARRGAAAVGLDRHAPPHPLGSSGGETRITRQGVAEGPHYGPLVLASHRVWRDLEAATGDRLLEPCGALLIGPAAPTGPHDLVANSITNAQRFGIPHEVLSGAEARQRFPLFLGLSGQDRAYYEPGGGYVRPERCIGAQLSRATALGATVLTETEALAVHQDSSSIRITTATETIIAGQAVVAAGAWTRDLVGPALAGLLTVSRQVLHWYELDESATVAPDSPVFIWGHGPSSTDEFYGFPPLPGERRLKVATEQDRTTTQAPSDSDRLVAAGESATMYRQHVAGRLAGVTPRVAGALACFYTLTPDRHFIIDRHPEHDRLLVVSACSGHGFKHSAGIGEALAETILEGRSRIDLGPFSLARFAA